MKKYRKSKKFKWKTFGIVSICIILGAAILAATGTEVKLQRDRNEDNLILLNEDYIESGTADKGVEWKVSEDGTIKLYGAAKSDDSIAVQTVTLEAGMYTYSDGRDKVNKDDFYSYVLVGGTEYIGGSTNATFTLEEAATVSVFITWFEGADFGQVLGTTFRPCLVEGKNVGTFFEK